MTWGLLAPGNDQIRSLGSFVRPLFRGQTMVGDRWVIGFILLTAAFNSGCSKSSPSAAIVPVSDRPGPESSRQLFEDITKPSGIDFAYRNGEESGHFAIIESLGGGVALFDFDGDGLVDVFLPGGGQYEGEKVLGAPGRLYRNRGKLKFEDVSQSTGVDRPFQYTHGAAAFDYDGDGWTDLLLSGYARLTLLRNEASASGGGRRFVDVTEQAGLRDAMWSSSVAWGDLDGDGWPDLYVCHYGNWGFQTNHPKDCSYDGKMRDVCQPARFQPLPHTIYRNDGKGKFIDVSAAMKMRTDGRGMGSIIVDLNGDRRPDIYVANDTDDNFLYRNRSEQKSLALEEVGRLAGVARDDVGKTNGSMGLDAADFDRSGKPSIIVTNYENELPALYLNRSTPTQDLFSFGTMTTGLSAIQAIYVSWGTGFHDFDHDGWEDLVIVNGHAIRFPTKIDRRQKPVFATNLCGKFRMSSLSDSYFKEPHNARGMAFGDLDNDGKVDMVISHLNEPVTVLHNIADTKANQWVGASLRGKSGRCVVGARVEITTSDGRQTRYVKGGGSFASTNDSRLVFGLGEATTVTNVTVHWPWGEVEKFAGVQPGKYWQLVEGTGSAVESKSPR